MILLVAALAAAGATVASARDWAVHTDNADELAEAHNLENLGEVLPNSKIYHLAMRGSEHTHRAKRELIHESLTTHPQVRWVERQEVLARAKRMPVECYISTIPTEKKISRRCVFPFTYKGKKYNSCTADHSSNSKPWCATEVRSDGQVISGKWGDCDFTSCSGEVASELPQRPPPQRPPPQRPPPQRPPPQQQAPPRFLPPPPSRGQSQNQFNPQVLPPPSRPRSQRPPGPGLGNNNFLGLLANQMGLQGFAPGRRPGPPFARPPVGEDLQLPEPPKLEDLQTQWNDPKWPEMWFLNRGYDNTTGFALDMNVEEAWAMGASGKGVVVTILDDGVEKFHPDLMANYDEGASIDLNDNDRDPSPRYDLVNSNKHGTRCAGQVSASANNSECGVGIAFKSGIGGVRVLDGPITDALEAKALSFNRDHIDIYSASWGPDDDGNTVDGPGTLASRALEEGVKLGRKGKGSIFMWASGNGGKFADNCNADGYTTSPFTLSVSSASENGKIPWYSEPCSSSIASTFSSGSKQFNERKITTTDLYGKCTNSHTGTSASSPIASGIVALALEVNPELNWRDVQHLTVRTCRPRGLLEARDWADNGVGLSFSHSFGFGLMDAGAMVKLAKEWKTVPEQQTCAIKGAPAQSYGIRGGVQRSFIVTVDEDHPCAEKIQFLEHLHVFVDISSRNVRRGNLMVVVESPSGTTSTLLGFRPADQVYGGFSLFNKWPMMSVHFWGENPVGNWTLTVVNRSPEPEDNAEMFDWTLKFYGTREDPQPGTGVLDHRQVDKNGRKISNEVAEEEVALEGDLSEARGLEALEAHTKLTKEAIDFIHPDLLGDVADDITDSVEEQSEDSAAKDDDSAATEEDSDAKEEDSTAKEESQGSSESPSSTTTKVSTTEETTSTTSASSTESSTTSSEESQIEEDSSESSEEVIEEIKPED